MSVEACRTTWGGGRQSCPGLGVTSLKNHQSGGNVGSGRIDGSDGSEPIGVAIVGAGYWGPNLVRNFGKCSSFQLRWLCDLDYRRAEAVLGPYTKVSVTSDLEAVTGDPHVDAVAIATPAATHFDVAMTALQAGKHVLVEKPLAATYAQGRDLIAAAEDRQLVLMCDHTYCYTPAVTKIRDILQSGELGDLHFFDSVRINLGLVQQDIDVLWDLAPHDLSILDSILPPGIEPLAVTAHGADPIGAGRSCVAFVTLELARLSGFQRVDRYLKVLRLPLVIVVEERNVSRVSQPDADI